MRTILVLGLAAFMCAFLLFAGHDVEAQQKDDEEARELIQKQLVELRGLYETLRQREWEDDDGRPKGVPEAHWKAISSDVGMVWLPRGQRKADQAIFAVRIEGGWHAVDPVGIQELWYIMKQ